MKALKSLFLLKSSQKYDIQFHHIHMLYKTRMDPYQRQGSYDLRKVLKEDTGFQHKSITSIHQPQTLKHFHPDKSHRLEDIYAYILLSVS